VFPTETVYGVGAHAFDEAAVRKVFAAKGRPPDNPLIVHAVDLRMARSLATRWPSAADALARAFWPGPLTLVVPRVPALPAVAAAGLDSVAVRVPAHPVARALLAEAGVPVAAPSANRSGRPSPTRVDHAVEDLGDAVAVYLDGGPCEVGVESTVVSVLSDPPVVLRPGGVSKVAIERVVGQVAQGSGEAVARSPGMRHRHYAPRAEVVIVEPDARATQSLVEALERQGRRVAVLASREHAPAGKNVVVPGGYADVDRWARSLFASLRDLDRLGYDVIVVQRMSEEGVGAAVLDRLRRAAERSAD